MQWISDITGVIDIIESYIETDLSAQDIARSMEISYTTLQQLFRSFTGYTVAEYIRNRRLYQAALKIISTDESISKVAWHYGYTTVASFTRAFTRYHGNTPISTRKNLGPIRTFLRMHSTIVIQGGEKVLFRIVEKPALCVVGIKKAFSGNDVFNNVVKFWDETTDKYAPNIRQGKPPANETEQYIFTHRIGEFGISFFKAADRKSFEYMICGYDIGEEMPEGFTKAKLNEGLWAVFDCTISEIVQTKQFIYKEWLPFSGYKSAYNYNMEWNSRIGEPGLNRKCEIWIPVMIKTENNYDE